jgi:MFS family permease
MRSGLALSPQKRIYGAFFIYSFALGQIFPRIGDLQRQIEVEEGALGFALTGPAIGTLIALTFFGPLVDRIGYRRVLMSAIPLLSIVLAISTLMLNVATLFAVLLGAGLLIGSIEVVCNVEADRTEARVGRRIMNRAHAFWSFGFFGAGLVGAVAKGLEVSTQLHLFIMVPVVVAGTYMLLNRFEPSPARPTPEGSTTPRFAVPSGPILVLFVFTISAMLGEGAGNDWSVIFMRNSFEAAPFINAAAFATGAFAQAIARYFADGFVDRYGPATVARAMIAALFLGTLTVTFSPNPAVALIGFALMGFGTSGIFPLAMSAAAQRTDRSAAINVASLAQTSFVVFLFGPPLLGFVAEHYGIRLSFGLILPLVVASWFAAQALETPAPAASKAVSDG